MNFAYQAHTNISSVMCDNLPHLTTGTFPKKVLFIYFYFLNIFIGVWLIYNVVLVLGVQQSESVIHISTLFEILFPYRYYRVLSRIHCVV